jgi:hypothetical protein
MMNSFLVQSALFARSNVFDATRRHAQQHSQLSIAELVLGVVIFVSFVALLILLFKIFSPPEKLRGVNSPLRLFWDLCRAHKLKLSQRWLLWRISRELEMKDPALLFVEPELIDPDLIGKAFAGKKAEIKSLHDRLFEDVAESAA